MSYIDVAIPAVVGLLALAWPQAAFYGSRATPDARKIRFIRWGGIALLFVAALYLAIRLVGT